MTETIVLSARISPELKDQLEMIARQRRRESGDDWRLGDVVREALESLVEQSARTSERDQ